MPSGATARGDVIPVVVVFFLTQMHLTCLFLDTGWELCDLGHVTSLRPFFGRGTMTESVYRAVQRIQGGDAGRVCRVYSAWQAPPGA